MQKSRRRKTFSLLSSLLESLFAVCTRALSLSHSHRLLLLFRRNNHRDRVGEGEGKEGSLELWGGGRRLN